MSAWAAGAASSNATASVRIIGSSPSVGFGQAEHSLGDIAKDELRRDRRDPPHQRLAQVALDVILGGIAESAMGHHRLLAGIEARFAGEVLRRVRLRAAGLFLVIEPRGL